MADFEINTIITDNPFQDAVENAVYVLKEHMHDLNLRDVWGEDLIRIPRCPSVCVTWDSSEEEVINLSGVSARIRIINNLEIWYYHEEIANDSRKKEIVAKLNEICNVFRKHRSINGFCNVLRAEINETEYLPRMRENGIMGAGVIGLSAPTDVKVDNPD